MRTQPVTEASAWLPAELDADPSWRHTLTADDLKELDLATSHALARGFNGADFDRSDFDLPNLGPTVKQLVDGVENGRGVGLISGVPVDDYPEHALRVLYWGLGTWFGDLISQNSKGQLLAEVMDRGNSYADRNTRGFSTNAELLPHVDTSDMTTLLCVRTARSGGNSRIVSSTTVFNHIVEEHPEFLEVLYTGFYNDLRGEGPTGDINELTHRPIPIFSDHAGRVSCSYNDRMIRNGLMKREQTLSSVEAAALDFMRELTLREDLAYWFTMKPGDIQMVSNHSLFHSRSDFEDHPELERRRCLYRLWVNIHHGRELATDFADRYNTGPRGGVAQGDGARYVF